MIRFNINMQKALQVILWMIKHNHNEQINTYNLLKALFSADEYHLNRYGRPVVGDSYIAMPYGTVPAMIYDIIKRHEMTLNLLGIDDVPFVIEHHVMKLRPEATIDEGFLSKSDKEALAYGLNEYGTIDFNKVKEKNHKSLAWSNAIDKGVYSPVDYADMIRDDEMREELRENCRHIVF